MQIKFISSPPAKPPGLFRKIVAVVVAVVLVGLVLMFSAVLLAVILIVGGIGFAYLWWKTRAVRGQLREMQERMRQMNESAAQAGGTREEVFRGEVYEGEIIEGEAVRVHETDVRIER